MSYAYAFSSLHYRYTSFQLMSVRNIQAASSVSPLQIHYVAGVYWRECAVLWIIVRMGVWISDGPQTRTVVQISMCKML